MIPIGYTVSLGYGILCLLLSWVLYKLGVPKKITRKVVHILVGFEWVILYKFFGYGVHFTAVCILFLILLAIEYKTKLFPMISSDGDNSPGTMYYAIAMLGVSLVGFFLPEVMLPFGIGVFCTSMGDGFAGLLGQAIKKGNPRIYANKTLVGTLTNLFVSTLSAFLISKIYGMNISIWQCLILGLLSVELELVTARGFDNITVTWGVTALAYGFMYFGGIGEYLIPILFTPIIIMFVNLKDALSRGGLMCAILLDIIVTIAFGTFGFVILCTFFFGSIVVDKIKSRAKNGGRNAELCKKERRNYAQVLANGAVSSVFAVAFLVTKIPVFIVPFVASLAEAFADTAASGIGIHSEDSFDLFRWKKCAPGLSGGISFIGTLASLLAAFLVAVIALAFRLPSFRSQEFFIVAISAFFGALVDSMLGSLFQIKYKCSKCSEITEAEEHCGLPTVRYSGFAAMDNNLVNFISCASASLLAIALTFAF